MVTWKESEDAHYAALSQGPQLAKERQTTWGAGIPQGQTTGDRRASGRRVTRSYAKWV